MATLSIWNYLSINSLGAEQSAKHGAITDAAQVPFDITVTGHVFEAKGTLATASDRSLWDEDSSFPATFAYLFLWVDQIAALQLIAQSSNVQHRIAAKQPFVLPGYSTLVAAANTTPITGSAEPTWSQIDSIILANYSGSTLNYHLALVL